MADYSNLLLSQEGSTLTITINRESKLNALNKATLEELRRAVSDLMDDKSIKGVIITGPGEKAFVAGADISEFRGVDATHARKFAEEGQEVFQLIEDCHTPIIAVVNGFALGGGCELAMACHMRIATADAKFGQPEVNLGLIPGYGGTQRMTKLIGKGRAFEFMMTADMITADKAESMGLVNHVSEDKEAAMDLANAMLSKIGTKAPIAIGQLVDCINQVYGNENGYQVEANAFANCVNTEDFKEGVDAFMNKRQANFKGE